MPEITPFVLSAAHNSAAAVLHYSGGVPLGASATNWLPC